MGQVCLIAIFQYWEDYYRGEIAKAIEIEKNDLKSDIFDDLRLIRNSIVHHRGIALKEIEKCTVLNNFKEGNPIILTGNELHVITQLISSSLADIIITAANKRACNQSKLPNIKPKARSKNSIDEITSGT